MHHMRFEQELLDSIHYWALDLAAASDFVAGEDLEAAPCPRVMPPARLTLSPHLFVSSAHPVSPSHSDRILHRRGCVSKTQSAAQTETQRHTDTTAMWMMGLCCTPFRCVAWQSDSRTVTTWTSDAYDDGDMRDGYGLMMVWPDIDVSCLAQIVELRRRLDALGVQHGGVGSFVAMHMGLQWEPALNYEVKLLRTV